MEVTPNKDLNNNNFLCVPRKEILALYMKKQPKREEPTDLKKTNWSTGK